MKIRQSDMLLVRASRWLAGPLWHLANIESVCLEKRLSNIAIDRPIFITGMARAGSTMLLELFSRLPSVVTQRYQDFPFVGIPWLWNEYLRLSRSTRLEQVERPHGDGITIASDSPEAMDEPLWRRYGANLPQWQFATADRFQHHAMTDFYRNHLRKLLYVRGGTRLVMKNNYHIARVPLLASMVDAHFVVLVRHPVAHVSSLVEQHARFCQYAQKDRRVTEYLATACHFEFGPQRRAFCPNPNISSQVEACWARSDDATGYALQWADVYAYVLRLLSEPLLCGRISLARYEDLCEQPSVHWDRLCKAFDLASDSVVLDHIHTKPIKQSLNVGQQQDVWSLTQKVAERLGYHSSMRSGQ